MADQKAKKAEPQQPVVPAEEKVSDAESAQEAAPVSEEATEEAPTSELPEDAKQRTREQFDKLKGEKEALRQELDQYKTIRPTQPEKESKPLYDPTTGLVDTDALNRLGDDIASLKKENERLRKETGDKEVIEMLVKYPEMDQTNKDKFNQELFDEANRLWMHSQAYPESYGGRSLTQRQAASRAKKKVGKKETPKQRSERETVKEQASLGISGKPGQGVKTQTVDETQERLVMGTRLGKKQEMIERMRNIREAEEKKGGE